MLILGHLGCTLAATQAGEAAYKKISGRRFRAAGRLIDYRVLALGSMMPDIIDKPLTLILLPDVFEGVTRTIGHSLLFPLLLFVIWRLVSGSRRNFLLPLAIGSAVHLVLDGMFTHPGTLLWPFMGWGFVDGGHPDLFSSLAIPWTLPWNVDWLEFSEFLGSIFIANTLFGLWRERRQGVHLRKRRSPALVRAPAAPPD